MRKTGIIIDDGMREGCGLSMPDSLRPERAMRVADGKTRLSAAFFATPAKRMFAGATVASGRKIHDGAEWIVPPVKRMPMVSKAAEINLRRA